MDPASLLNLPPQVIRHRYDRRDTILYALGVGAGQDNLVPGDLQFVLEDRLKALPTMAVVLAYPGFWQMEPRYGIDWRRVLHAEQSCEFHAPLPPEGAVRGEFTIESIVDKSEAKGALLLAKRTIHDESDGRLLATVRQLSFLRGDGGRGGGGPPLTPLKAMPQGPADVVLPMTVRPEQALIYRLSGDYNPLHANPEVAREAGFPGPVLHGLCTYGFAGRAVIAAACEGDPARLKTLDCRFTAPVYPGDALEAHVWRVTANEAAFRVVAPAREAVVLDLGRAEIR